MPIIDQGYQHWQGHLSGHGWRWLTVARQGARVQPKSWLLRLLMWTSVVPALALAAWLVLWGLFEQNSPMIQPLLSIFRALPGDIGADPVSYRVVVWTIAYQYFFMVQLVYAMLLVVLLGPNLISQDLRFNAMPLYFSRPLRRFDYFLGKLGVIAIYLGQILLVPALLAYALGVCFSMDLTVVRDTARLMGGVILYCLVIILSAGTLVLAFSALSRNSRYVQVTWFGFWIVSLILSAILQGLLPREEWTPVVSYTRNLQRLELELLDTRGAWNRVYDAMFPSTGVVSRPVPQRPGPGVRPPPLGFQPPPEFRERYLNEVAGPVYPLWWSAAVLAGLLGISLCILTSRVRSLDRLR
jgi:ABC-2 type transport system permease protein